MDDDELGAITCPNCDTRCQPVDGQWVCRQCGVVVLPTSFNPDE